MLICLGWSGSIAYPSSKVKRQSQNMWQDPGAKTLDMRVRIPQDMHTLRNADNNNQAITGCN